MNPLLSKVKLPGRVFALPSLGVFYPPGILAKSVQNGEITVSPMSALTEMKLRSADLLYSGKIIREICSECAPEVLNSGALINKDIDALFTFLRIVTYGPTMVITSQHTCANAKPHTYEHNIETILTKPNNGVLKHHEVLYRVQLSNGQIVNLKPNTYEEALKVIHMRLELEQKESEGKPPTDDELTQLALMDLLNVIVSVQNTEDETPVTNPEHIMGWLKSIQKNLFGQLIQGVNKSELWGFDYTLDLVCKDCGGTYKHALDLNPSNFFFG